MLRCRFKLSQVHHLSGGSAKLIFEPVADDTIAADQAFFRGTPQGRFEVICTNPAAIAQLRIDGELYLDVTLVPPPSATQTEAAPSKAAAE